MTNNWFRCNRSFHVSPFLHLVCWPNANDFQHLSTFNVRVGCCYENLSSSSYCWWSYEVRCKRIHWKGTIRKGNQEEKINWLKPVETSKNWYVWASTRIKIGWGLKMGKLDFSILLYLIILTRRFNISVPKRLSYVHSKYGVRKNMFTSPIFPWLFYSAVLHHKKWHNIPCLTVPLFKFHPTPHLFTIDDICIFSLYNYLLNKTTKYHTFSEF